ncbi:RNA polymerase sigma factor [Flavobacterium cerinum]|uniref:RNA polymerase sigma factor n=1 Tax=Flavobacterium cerinum TaxID=2502784 RepID=A0ABY5IPD6_9FLAO|nr:RNA polymerase sigma factor [Flavobacterium cerinum]UUC44141.1 RNA polymerase sigma factor [Flavobacterium cerinum]
MDTSETHFIDLIEKHKGILCRIVQLYAYNREDREDLQQDIIIQLWKSYPSFRGESKFSTWMYRVAVNTSITYIKQEKRKPKANYTENFPEIRDTPYNDEKDIQSKAFFEALQTLKPIEKALMFLYLENLSHRKIGENLGISEGNARVKLSRVKEKLQIILKKNGHEF